MDLVIFLPDLECSEVEEAVKMAYMTGSGEALGKTLSGTTKVIGEPGSIIGDRIEDEPTDEIHPQHRGVKLKAGVEIEVPNQHNEDSTHNPDENRNLKDSRDVEVSSKINIDEYLSLEEGAESSDETLAEKSSNTCEGVIIKLEYDGEYKAG